MSTPRFAFIVHARRRSDLLRKFPIMRLLPESVFDWITLHMPPFVVSKITGLKGPDGKDMEGVVMGIAMTAHQLLEHRELALKRIIQASKLAESKGARFIGLGAMTASLSRGGRDVIDHLPNVYITTGRTYTTKNISEYIDHCVSRFGLNKETVKVGIIGAAGGIGSSTAIVLARKGYRNFVLVDLERKLETLKKRILAIEEHSSEASIVVSHQLSAIADCGVIVAATSAPEVVLKSEHVQPGTIIINDAQPSDVSPEIVENRKDVLVIEGGVVASQNINCHFNMGLAKKTDIFSCLAETLLLAYGDAKIHYSVDDFDADLYEHLEEQRHKIGLQISDFQNDLGYIPKRQLEEFDRIIRARYS